MNAIVFPYTFDEVLDVARAEVAKADGHENLEWQIAVEFHGYAVPLAVRSLARRVAEKLNPTFDSESIVTLVDELIDVRWAEDIAAHRCATRRRLGWGEIELEDRAEVKEYAVSCSVAVSARSPREAAALALATLRAGGAQATHFDVVAAGESTSVAVDVLQLS